MIKGSGYASADAASAPSPDKLDAAASKFGDEEESKEDAIRAKAVSGGRRRSFSAESATDDAIKNYKCPFYSKSEEAKKTIADSLKGNSKMQILGIDRCNKGDFDELVMAFQERTVTQDEDVIKQGDDGDCLYIVDDGNFDIFVARVGDGGQLLDPAKVANFGPGSLFGELAIMYSAPRAATVRCATATAKLWSLDRTIFQMMIKRCGVHIVEQYSGWLTEVEILKVLNVHEISKLADACEEILLDEDTVIMRQGDAGDAFYILEEGHCEAFIDSANGEEMVKKYDKQGDYFGELALINNAPRRATVKTITDSSLLKISKQEFDNLLGPLNDRLKALAREY